MEFIVKNIGAKVFFLKSGIEYIAKEEKKKFRPLWTLRNRNNILVANIRLKHFFRISYNRDFIVDFIDKYGQLYSFPVYYKGWWKPYYYTTFKNDIYEIIINKGNKRSFFINDIQVGIMIEKDISFGFETQFKVLCDDNVDFDFLATLIFISICLDNTDGDIININFGYIGPERKRFNNKWTPELSKK